jgi:hypothetical protein
LDSTQPYRYISGKEFADIFACSPVGESLKEELNVPFDKSRSHPAALLTENYGVRKRDLFQACFSRELLLMKRNSFVYVFKAFKVRSLGYALH